MFIKPLEELQVSNRIVEDQENRGMLEFVHKCIAGRHSLLTGDAAMVDEEDWT